MGFWYLMLLVCGIALLVACFFVRSLRTNVKFFGSITALSMIGLALFMFQDGSAEIVAKLLNLLKKIRYAS